MESDENLIEACGKLIAEKKLTIAFAESATAGKLAFEFSQTSHSGDILKGGLVCYDACIKEDILGVPGEMIEQYTAESAEVTRDMAIRIKKIMDTEISVAITGLTTPGGSERPGKPVGTMFFCILVKEEMVERRHVFSGSAKDIINLTIAEIAKTLIQVINK